MSKQGLFRNVTLSVLLGLVLIFGGSVHAKEIIIPSQPEKSTTEEKKKDTTEKSTTENNTTESKNTSEKATTESMNTTESDKQGNSKTDGWNAKKNIYYKNGKAVKGWNEIEGKLYYFTKKGKLYTKTGLRKISGARYYFNKAHYAETGVVKVKGKCYYFCNKDGSRFEKKGINKVDGKYYMFADDYTLISGWQRNSKNKRYYFDKKTYRPGLAGIM